MDHLTVLVEVASWMRNVQDLRDSASGVHVGPGPAGGKQEIDIELQMMTD